MFNSLSEPSDVGSILSQLFHSQSKALSTTIKTRLQKKSLIQNWQGLVGVKIAEHSKPIDIKGQEVVVVVDEIVWLDALQQKTKEVNDKINKFLELKENKFKDEILYEVKFMLGKIYHHVSHNSSALKKEKGNLDTKTKAEIDRVLAHLKNNEDLKQTFHNILVKHYQCELRVKNEE